MKPVSEKAKMGLVDLVKSLKTGNSMVFVHMQRANLAEIKRRGNLVALYRSVTPDHVKVRLQWENGEMSDGPEVFRFRTQ